MPTTDEQIARLIRQANRARWQALTAPTEHQARAANRLADRCMEQAKEAAKDA